MRADLVLPVLLKLLTGTSSTEFTYRTKGDHKYRTDWFDQKIDHYSLSGKGTFKQKVLIGDQFFGGKGHPIFFYCGNEGPIETFEQNTGLMWELAPEFKALVIFQEHRYYGESWPFGKNMNYSDPNQAGFLTVSQALGDFAEYLNTLRQTEKYSESPVIAFGGSYGAMLAGWMRQKYPHLVQGALAASAPLMNFVGLLPCDGYATIASKDYKNAASGCGEVVKRVWPSLKQVQSMGPDTWKQLRESWNLCSPLSSPKDIGELSSWVNNLLSLVAMVDYPYPTNFIGTLPASPVKAFCKEALKQKQLTSRDSNVIDFLKAFRKGISPLIDHGNGCLNASLSFGDDKLGTKSWSYQVCADMIMPQCSSSEKGSLFPETEWSLSAYTKECKNRYHVSPRPYIPIQEFGPSRLQYASNIIYSNGELDPWMGYGILKSPAPSIHTFVLKGAAHHLDLRTSNPADPPDVVQARKQYRKIFRGWISEYKKNKNSL